MPQILLHMFDSTTGTRSEKEQSSTPWSGLELKKLKVRLHARTPNSISLAFPINAPTIENAELLGDAVSRQAHSGKTETTIFSERNSCKSKVSILSREMIEG